MYKKAIVMVLMLLLALILLPSCGGDEVGSLAVRLEGSKLVWDAYPGAAYYTVKCEMTDGNGYSIKVTDTFFQPPATLSDDYRYVITAKDGDGKALARSSAVSYHLGLGSAADPILIATADELLAIKGSKSATYGETTITIPLYYRLEKDIDLSGVQITPIGNGSNPFSGVFDGDGHKITGLSFTKAEKTCDYYGLFGAIKNAQIKNLIIEEGEMLLNKNSGETSTKPSFGFLAGSVTDSLIDNCHVTGNMDLLSDVDTIGSTSYLYAGGIAGRVNASRMEGCSFKGSISARFATVSAGGLVGEIKETTTDGVASILNSIAEADVNAFGTAYTASTGEVSAAVYAGVLIGNVSGASKLKSLVAIGNASAGGRDGASVSKLLSGVFGRTYVFPIEDIYYRENSGSEIRVSGSLSDKTLSAYAGRYHALSESALKEQASYLTGEETYGLDFDEVWEFPEGEYPTPIRKEHFPTAPSLTLVVRSETEDVAYELDPADIFLPAYYEHGAVRAEYAVGYDLASLLSSLGLTVKKGDRVRFSAEGAEELTVTVQRTTLMCFLDYASYPTFEKAEPYNGYKLVNDDDDTIKTYDFTSAKTITITILPAESAGE